MAAQITHAAGESVETEILPGTNAVVLEVPNETALREIARKLSKAGIKHVLIREVDPPWDGQCTAIGCTPLQDRTLIKKILSKLPLLGKNGSNPEECRKTPPSAMHE